MNPVAVTNLRNQVETWSVFTAPFNVRTESGEHLEWNFIPRFERLDRPFEISSGVVIPPGSYRWTRYRAEVNTATKRPWVVDATWWWGGFYPARLRQLELGVTLKRNTHVALSAQAESATTSRVRSHTFRFITPALTESSKIPNPCTSCHKDKSNGWASETLRSWPEFSPWRVAP